MCLLRSDGEAEALRSKQLVAAKTKASLVGRKKETFIIARGMILLRGLLW